MISFLYKSECKKGLCKNHILFEYKRRQSSADTF